MTEHLKPIRNLVCCCCGTMTRGRQWWNRDKGFGLCEDCGVNLPEKGVPPEEMRDLYGVAGVHYCLPAEAAAPVEVRA